MIRTVAIIGAGTAGRAFALRCARAGFDVVLEDVMPEKLRRAQDEYAEYAEYAESTEYPTANDNPAGSLRYATTVEDAVAAADLAIDFVPDELESKLEIFSLLDRMAPPRTVLCTPTDALSITDLASCTYRAERCIGVRGGVNQPSVELVSSRFLDPAIQQTVLDFFATLGTQPTVVEDSEPMLVKNQP